MKFPCQGHFWLPGSPEKSIFGTLGFNRRDGATLTLANPLSADRLAADVIVGQTSGGAYVTLLHVNQTAAPLFQLTKTNPCSYHATFLILGAAFDSTADLRFSLWQIRVPGLNEWVGEHGFAAVNPYVTPAAEDSPAVQITYQTPENRQLLATEAGLNLKLAFWPLLKTSPFERTLRQGVCLEIRQGVEDDALESYMKTTTRFEHLLTLATGNLIRTGSITAVLRTEDTDDQASPVIVDVLYQPVRNVSGSNSRNEFLFALPDITGIEQDCIANWFGKATWLDPVCALYFGTLYNPSRYLDFNFLALVQAVEAYHRRASDETDQPPSIHESRLKAILEATPAEHRPWLGQKLAYSNEISLRRRLKSLFGRFPGIFDGLLADKKMMINAIYENRNYMTHYDPATVGRPLPVSGWRSWPRYSNFSCRRVY